MQEIGYDELYGLNIDEYCKAHNISINDLINKTSIDIDLLKKRLQYLIWTKDEILNPLTCEVFKLLNKKQKHLERLKKWKKKH